MARLPPVLGRFAKAKMAISWSKWTLDRSLRGEDADVRRPLPIHVCGLLCISGRMV